MPNQIQAGTMMVQQSTIPRSLGVESELYCQNWRSLGTLESSRLDQKVRAAGWNLFFMVGELRAVAPAWGWTEQSAPRGEAAPGSNSAPTFQLPGTGPHTQETLPWHSIHIHSCTPASY